MSCNTWVLSRFVHREIVVLTILVCITIAAFFGTRAVAQSNEALRRRQAAALFETAQLTAREGPSAAVVANLRRAVSKDPGNRRYRLALAEALGASGLDDEAGRVLLALRESQPDDPDANLQLARLDARRADTDGARRYYQDALADLWRPEQSDDRRVVQFELIEFLIARNERARALSELLLLAANVPEDAGLQVRVGRLFLAASDAGRALDHFTNALRLSAMDPVALTGAGEAAFAVGDYSLALRYLKAAPDEAHVVDLRAVAGLVLGADPLAPRLGTTQRRQRLAAALTQARERLESCLDTGGRGSNELEALRGDTQALAAELPRQRARDTRDLVEDGLDLVYRAERAAAVLCGQPTSPFDRALLLIGRRRASELP